MTIFSIALRPIDAFLNQSPVFRVDPLENTFNRGLDGSVVSIDPEGFFRPEHFASGEAAAEAAGLAQSLRLGQVGFAAAQFLFCFFAVVNVSQQEIPARDTTFRVSQGETARLEPAVHTVGSTLTKLIRIRLPGFDRVLPRVEQARKVIRMDGVAGGPILQFLGRLAEIFPDLAVEKFHLACRTHGAYKPRNGIDDQA
ncbi:MAG: hypothetical protein AUG04_06295 [Deltaproteobacteria bacterium 13_1_20CM_2_69_21]|nr:MAG: hypothetical protein AUG04_06295 [Deltaproteobacteria bacterium 13_1_20CM_2_69_21]